ncbi:MAG: P-II family nitrogen regulator [Ruminococcaceae bacterium]|nr:P-II family nitrogen regulator [Oscillospiraceae bacterium]
MKNIHMLITITRREDREEFIQYYTDHEIPVVYSTMAEGTARRKTLSRLGLEKTDKSLHFAILPGNRTPAVLKGLTREMQIDLPDRGVALAIPLSSVGGARTLQFFMNGAELDDVEGEPMESAFELIIAVAAAGYTDLVMDAAREGGAGGGTVVHAKGTAAANAEKFFGMSLAEEKEMIFIVTTGKQKKDIMRAIMQKAGVDSDAHALVFSLPVAATAGFRLLDADEADKE